MIMELSPIERRVHPRHRVPAGVTVDHPASQKSFPARAEDISEGGICMAVPPTTPIRAGQEILVSLGAFEHDGVGHLASSQRKAIIVRVDRQSLLTEGTIEIGAQFA